MEVIVPVLGGVIVMLAAALISLVLNRLRSQDTKIETMTPASVVATLKADLLHDIDRLERARDIDNNRHTTKNHDQDTTIRGLERLLADSLARIAALERWRNGKPHA